MVGVFSIGVTIPGIFPDILHILDLALYVDCIASAFLDWTDTSGAPFSGRSRDERLLQLYAEYVKWCQDNRYLTLIYIYRYLSNLF